MFYLTTKNFISHSLTGSTEISIGSATSSSSASTGPARLITSLPSAVPVDALLAFPDPAAVAGEGEDCPAAAVAAWAGGAAVVLLCLRMAPRPRFTPRCACGITLHCSFGGSCC